MTPRESRWTVTGEDEHHVYLVDDAGQLELIRKRPLPARAAEREEMAHV